MKRDRSSASDDWLSRDKTATGPRLMADLRSSGNDPDEIPDVRPRSQSTFARRKRAYARAGSAGTWRDRRRERVPTLAARGSLFVPPASPASAPRLAGEIARGAINIAVY